IANILQNQMYIIDLKSEPDFADLSASLRKGLGDELRPNYLLPTDGSASHARVSQVRGTLPGLRQNQKVLLPGPVPRAGLCPAHLARKLARHRSLPALATTQALSHGPAWRHRPQHAGRRQRNSVLEDLGG